MDSQTVQRFRQRLESRVREVRGINHRTAERYPYAVEPLVVELAGAEERIQATTVAGRNISRTGVGLLSDQLVYPGMPCRVTLRTLHGQAEPAHGRVARCRYLVGSASLYELGIRLDRPIDPTLFAKEAQHIVVLLAGSSPEQKGLVRGLFEPLRVEVATADTAEDVRTATENCDYDLILLDLENLDQNPFLLTRGLRRKGYLGAIVGLSLRTAERMRFYAERAGLTGYLSKPITRGALASLIETLRVEPLLSTLREDASLTTLINEFVGGLRERAKQMVSAMEQGDLKTVWETVVRLRGEAGSYGFYEITEQSEQVQAMLSIELAPQRYRGAVMDLAHLCLAARPIAAEPDPVAKAFVTAGNTTPA